MLAHFNRQISHLPKILSIVTKKGLAVKKRIGYIGVQLFFMEMMMKSYVKALAVVACLALSQTALARQVAVCHTYGPYVNPLDSIDCQIGNVTEYKNTTLFELTKAGWSIQAVTPVQEKQERAGDSFGYITRIYLEKP